MNQPQMYESASISVFSNMAAHRAGFEDDDNNNNNNNNGIYIPHFLYDIFKCGLHEIGHQHI